MNIQEFGQKSKDWLHNDDVFTTALIVLVAAASFGLGRSSVDGLPASSQAATAIQGTEQVYQESAARTATTSAATEGAEAADAKGMYVGSKNSNKYHLPWCSGAKRIKEENKVWFASKEEAAAKGYTPAGNCEGI